MQFANNLGQLFEAVAEQNATQTALLYECNAQNVSYELLNRKANSYAQWLASQQVKKGDVVAIFSAKSTETFAFILACLKRGVVYTNLDPESPIERIMHILDTCSPKLLVSDFALDKQLIGLPMTICQLHSALSQVTSIDASSPNVIVNGHDPAYIMFTSGSTGKPKGVTISHQNLINFIYWIQVKYQPSQDDIVSNLNPLYFDNSVFDIYAALFSGAALAPVNTFTINSPSDLKRHLEAVRCTIVFAVPSLYVYLITLKLFKSNAFDNVRIFTFGGEAFPKPQLKRIYDQFCHQARFINVYGPTEGTCICSSYDVSDTDFEDMNSILPLGSINPNFDYLVINEDSKVCNDSEIGELCLIGNNLSCGYYARADLTNKSFVSIPSKHNVPMLMYKTGDLVTHDEHGILYFCGRKDFQIKHLGYRIELEEIEHVINGCNNVIHAAVIYQKQDTFFGAIIAFVVAKKALTEADLRAQIDTKLPYYMLPDRFIFVDELAKNANGKIDRQTLMINQLPESSKSND